MTTSTTRKQEIAAEIARQRAAKVIHRNEPNPVLMQMAAEQILAANLRSLEAEWRAVQQAGTAHWVRPSSTTG